MKSYGGLWERIVSRENFEEAWRLVRKGRGGSRAILAFGVDAERRLESIRQSVVDGTFSPGPYRRFRVLDPKPRTISCAPIKDRIVHHALCNVIGPLFEKRFIANSYACRVGKGMHQACRAVRKECAAHAYFCKMDVRRYFESIPHDRMLRLLFGMFREDSVRRLLATIVRSASGTSKESGLPIGNLTSQWFANFYLDGLDHYLAEVRGLGGSYFRYMDDFLFFTEDKQTCWALCSDAREWLHRERGLETKDAATIVAPTSEGIPFLGLRIYPGSWRLLRRRFLHTRRIALRRQKEYLSGQVDEKNYVSSLVSMDGGVRWFGFKGILNHLASGEKASSGSYRVNRGGSWNNAASNCRSGYRNKNSSSNANRNNGFRLSSTRLSIGREGSHPERPELRECGDEHARTILRSVSMADAVPKTAESVI